jgi:CBS domain-containing protein
MNSVNQLLKGKGSDIWSMESDAPVFESLKMMGDKNIGALLVIEDGKLMGIFSERDYARNSILRGNSCIASSIGQLMTKKVYYVSPEDSIETCMAMMSEKHIRHLPVLEKGSVVGMITLGDVVKQIISNQEFKIRELEKYIQGEQ